MSWTFLATTLVIVATPGTGALFTIAAGLTRGAKASLVAATGCTLGIVPHMLAAITGVAAILHTSAVAFQILKFAGVAYLLYLAWLTWRDNSPLVVEKSAPLSTWRVIRTAVFINLLNPKLTIFFFAFLPQFVRPGSSNEVVRMLGLSGAFMLATLLVFATYGAFAAGLRRHVVERPRVVTWLRRSFAGTYVVLAGRLAATSR
jgi:threonine/homoserine/homoserine lactone efflux protein